MEKESIKATVISSRNMLFNSSPNSEVWKCLKELRQNIASISNASTREAMSYCIEVVLILMEQAEFRKAGDILNLLHNLPIDVEDEKMWDIDYFLSMELVSFLRKVNKCEEMRLVALKVVSEIASEYL
jgi:hypothetical protein